MCSVRITLIGVGGLLVSNFMGAAPFRNLGFDEANVDSTVELIGGGPTPDLLPGWQLFKGSAACNPWFR